MKSARAKVIATFSAMCLIVAAVALVREYEIIPHNQLDKDLRSSIKHNRGGTIQLSLITKFQWDRMHIFPPYGTVLDPEGRKQDIDEGHCALQFTKNNKIVFTLLFKRIYGDFSELYRDEGYTPEESKFAVEGESDHWLKIRKIGKELPNQAL